jgi:acyl transferase domain-containing protein/acyl carrier protein
MTSASASDEKLREYLKRATIELNHVHSRLRSVEDKQREPIAIVGMACRFPGDVRTPEQLWELLARGGDAIAGFPADRGWDLDALYDPDPAKPGKTYTRHGGFLRDVAGFDADLFGISPREALAMDPQQRQLLEVTWEAMERARIDPRSLRGSQTGVFVGTNGQDYASLSDWTPPEVGGYVGTGNAAAVMSGRLSYVFGLEGPAATIDTACSSSLVATHLACQALRVGECSLALAAGVTVMSSPSFFVEFSREHGGLAPDGRCKAFSASADGTGLSEGVAILVLERLSDARRNGRCVLGVVRGSAINQDGASSGLTAPNGPSQQRVIRKALDSARVSADEIDAVEAHGTGTRLGDPIEAQALLATYGQGRAPDRPVWLGSVKTNLGHTQAAAGIAGVIKMVLAMQHGVVPRSLHAGAPTPHVDWSAGAVALAAEAVAWPRGDRPRRAGVSSFGVSGTNAHVILEEAITPDQVEAREPPPARAVPWVLSARTGSALARQAERLRARVRADATARVVDLGYSLATTRAHLEHRAAIVATERDGFLDALDALVEDRVRPGLVRGVARGGKVVLVFPGQGSQWAGMAGELMAASEVFRARMVECAEAMQAVAGWPVLDAVLGAPGAPPLERVDVVQPALFAAMVSLAALWRSYGVEPAAVIGHSQGEIAAACVSGALSLEDAARIVVVRSQAVREVLAGRGGMLSVALGEAEARRRLGRWQGRISLAAVNSPESVVVAGEPEALAELEGELSGEGVRARRIAVDYASHTRQVEALRERLLDSLADVAPRRTEIPFLSTVTGEWLEGGELTAAYWYENLRQPVQLAAAARRLAQEGHGVFIEASPHPVLTVPIQETIDAAGVEGAAIGSLRRNEGGLDRFVLSLAEAHANGAPVDWSAVFAGDGAERVDLPTYAFGHERYWLERGGHAGAEGAAPRADAGESAFWQALERGDADAVASTVARDDAGASAVRAAVPVLAAWRRQRKAAQTVESWRYRIVWNPVEEPTAAPSGTWLIVGSAGAPDAWATGLGHAFAGAGARVISVRVDRDAATRTGLAARLRELVAGEPAIAGVVSLLALEPPSSTATTLALVQALGDAAIGARPWLATCGAVAVDGAEPLDSPRQAEVWGLGRVVALEHPERWGGLVDLPPSPDARAFARIVAVLAGMGEEDQIAVRPAGVFVRRLVRAPRTGAPPRRWTPRGAVLVTGATGVLGPHLARWLAHGGAEEVILTSRRGADAPGMLELARELASHGTRVTAAACDVGDRDALAALLARRKADGAPIRAVMHAAAVISLAPLEQLSAEELASVLHAKAGGAANLHELLADEPLDAFVLFSSIAGVWGSRDHGAYAAANAYLDALAQHRRAHGQVATSIAWGVWDVWDPTRLPDGIKPDQLRARGLPFLPREIAFAALQDVLDHDEVSPVVADVDWARFAPVFSSAGPRRLLDGVPEARRALDGAAAPHAARAGEPARTALAGVAEADRARVLLDLVRSTAAGILGHASSDRIDAQRAFRDLGFDSLMALEFRKRVNEQTGLRLPATLVFNYPTPAALARHLDGELGGARREPAPAVIRPAMAGDDDPIAIVGMSCRFPGGIRAPEDLWRFLVDGRDAIGEFPTNRGWDVAALYDPDPERPGKTYTRQGGFLHDAADFDPAFFGISPREALAIDPQQRILLELAWEAFERAGIDPLSLRGHPTGVYIGCSYHDYGARLGATPAQVEGYLGIGNAASIASGRISYVLGLEGPALTLDTGCSSTLVAMHLGVQALRRGECALALCGAATVMVSPSSFTELSRQRGLAADGRCKPFAASADGIGFSEGGGVLVLERLSDARRHGRRALAIVRGIAVNQDGASNGLTAPNGLAQEAVIRLALGDARLSTSDVDAVEAHGTGTKLGDPIEAHALLATYGQDRPADRPLWVGSAKSNLGHTQAGSGAAGIIKMILAMKHGVLPKTLHVDEITPHVDWTKGAVSVLAEARTWPAVDRPRRSGVSSFSISGTNAHVVLEQAPPPDDDEAADIAPHRSAGAREIAWPLSAKTDPALRAQALQLRARIEADPRCDLADVGYSLATTRSVFDHRAVVLAHDREDFLRALSAIHRGAPDPGAVQGVARDGKVVFVFPSSGAQWAEMATELLDRSPVFSRTAEDCAGAFAPYLDWSILDVLRCKPGAPSLESVDLVQPGAPSLERIDVVEPVLFTMMVSLAALWRSYGVEPAAVLGHGQGEVAAACVAGALSLADAARIVGLRSQLLRDVLGGHGGMLSVALAVDPLRERLRPWGDRLSISEINGPTSMVVAGDPAALDELVERLTGDDVRVRRMPVDCATHCHQVEPLHQRLRDALAGVAPRAGAIPLISTVTGDWLDPRELDAEYWVRNICQPVLFEAAARRLLADGHKLFIEIGPHPVLAAPLQETLDAAAVEGAVVGSLERHDGGLDRFLASLAQVHVRGVRVDWRTLSGDRARVVDLPTYAFQRERYWLEVPASRTADVTAAGLIAADHPLLGAAVSLADDRFLFTGRLSVKTTPWLADHGMSGTILLPGTAFIELALHAGSHVGCRRIDELIAEAPLVLPRDGAISLQLSLDAADDLGQRSFTLRSRAADAPLDGAWTRHAIGVLARDAGAAPLDLDLEGDWPPLGATPVDLDGLYARFAELGYEYGPTFRGLRAAWRRGTDIFAEVRLHDDCGAEAREFGVHPALLDAALHALGLWTLDGSRAAAARMPFAWKGVSFHATGAPTLQLRVRVSATLDEATLMVADERGAPVAVVDSLEMRPVSEAHVKAARRAHVDSLFRIDWTVLPAPVARGRQDGGTSVIVGSDVPKLRAALTSAGFQIVETATMASLRAAIAAIGVVPEVVFVACFGDDESTDLAPAAAAKHALEHVQSWLADDRFTSSKLVFVTRGAVAIGPGEDVRDLAHATVWGLVRSAQTEHPDRFVLVDVDEDGVSDRALAAVLRSREPQIGVRKGVVHAPRLARACFAMAGTGDREAAGGSVAEGTVLITGGTGTLGRLVARHMVIERRMRHLTLVSRQGRNASGAAELEAELTQLGARVTIAACDVADREALDRVLAAIPPAHPLCVVIHTAAALDDGVVSAMTAESVDRVFRPKVDAAVHLHEATQGMNLAEFVLFSSAAGTFGSAGQANYAAANAFLDALAQRRRARGLPARALAWGMWAERSALTTHLGEADLGRMRRAGMAPLPSDEALALFDDSSRVDAAVLVLLRLDASALSGEAAAATLSPLLRGLVRPRALHSSEDAAASGSTLKEQLAGASAADRELALRALVRKHTAAALGHASADAVDGEKPFKGLGFDSLLAVELRNRLHVATGLRLSATLVFNHPTPAAVARHLSEKLFPGAEPGPARRPDVAVTLDTIDTMDLQSLIEMAGAARSPSEEL